ncbi:MAG: hypothetical protein IPG90_08255 [Bacteroidetes bacterium]|nr:hypothetical protein [Bacteroidota bacterium]
MKLILLSLFCQSIPIGMGFLKKKMPSCSVYPNMGFLPETPQQIYKLLANKTKPLPPFGKSGLFSNN